MIKESKNVDFCTTGRQPSEQDFARISNWIKQNKQQQAFPKQTKQMEATHTAHHHTYTAKSTS